MINSVTIRGFVADEPFIRATEESKMARIRVATTERVTIKKSGETREHTEWHSVTLWGSLADLVDRQIRVGAAVHIEGALRTNEWEDNKGKMHRTTEIVANKLEILDSIEGYKLPTPIANRIEELYPKNSASKQPKFEVKAPASDPDELPF